MADLGQLEPVTFRKTDSQRGLLRSGAIVSMTMGICALVFGSTQDKYSAELVIAGVLLLLFGIAQLARRNARTTIDRYGVRASSGFRWRSCPWSEVTDVSEHWQHASDAASSRRVRVQCSSGHSFMPTVPSDTPGTHEENPDFGIQLAAITSYWQTARSSQSRNAAP